MNFRRGSMLILSAGLASVLASIAAAFLIRMKTEKEESSRIVADAQARIMFTAACCYILESAPPELTPRNAVSRGDQVLGRYFSRWSAWSGSGRLIGRFPMAVPALTRHAVDYTTIYDPDVTHLGGGTSSTEKANDLTTTVTDALYRLEWDDRGTNRRPTTWRPDPILYAAESSTGIRATAQFPGIAYPSAGATWNPTPRADSVNMSWFRVYWLSYSDSLSEPYKGAPWPTAPSAYTKRATARFIITCGSGASQGFRDWAEVLAANAQDLFYNDPNAFSDVIANESRLYYEVDWQTVDVSMRTESVPFDPGPSYAKMADPQSIAEYYGTPSDETAKDCRAYSLSLTTDAFRYFGEIVAIRRILAPPSTFVH